MLFRLHLLCGFLLLRLRYWDDGGFVEVFLLVKDERYGFAFGHDYFGVVLQRAAMVSSCLKTMALSLK